MKEESFAEIVAGEGIPLPAADSVFAKTRAPSQTSRQNSPQNVLPPFDVGDDSAFAEKTEYRKNGIDKRRLRDLQKQTPEDDLDLHGMTAAEAHPALENFLRIQIANEIRNVEIIHGRGEHSADGVAVLRAKTRKWLAGCDFVLGFVEPRGNSGATLVLLKQRRRA